MALWHSPASIPVHHHQVVHRLDMCHAKRGNLMNRVANNACANCEYNAPDKDMTIDAHMLHLQGVPSLIPMCTTANPPPPPTSRPPDVWVCMHATPDARTDFRSFRIPRKLPLVGKCNIPCLSHACICCRGDGHAYHMHAYAHVHSSHACLSENACS